MLNSKFWGKYFKVYDTLNELRPYQTLLEKISYLLDLDENDLVLDAGSGTGNLCIYIENKYRSKTIGIDSSDEGIEVHKSKVNSSDILKGDILQTLPFQDNCFDKIASNNVLYTIPRTRRADVFKELYRVLKPGGKIVISNIKEDFKPVRIYKDHVLQDIRQIGYVKTFFKIIKFIIPTIKILYYNSKIKKENSNGEFDFFDDNEARDQLEKAGFVDVSHDILVYSEQAILNTASKPK